MVAKMRIYHLEMRFHWWVVDLCLSCSVSNHVKPFQSCHYLPFVRSSVRAMCKLFQVAYARATNSFRYSLLLLGKVSHAGDDTKARLPCRPERRGLDDNRMIFFQHLEMSILRGYPLVNVYITMENHHFQLVSPLFLWPCSIAMWVITRGYPSHHPWMTFLYWNRWPGDPPFWKTPTSRWGGWLVTCWPEPLKGCHVSILLGDLMILQIYHIYIYILVIIVL